MKDRPTRAHEYVFLLSKSERYYYDHQAIREPTKDGKGTRNRRTVWSINTNGFKGPHFAVFPPELVRLCVLAGAGPDTVVLDPFLGSGTVAEVCLQAGRKCVGIELKADYADIAVERLSQVQRQLWVD